MINRDEIMKRHHTPHRAHHEKRGECKSRSTARHDPDADTTTTTIVTNRLPPHHYTSSTRHTPHALCNVQIVHLKSTRHEHTIQQSNVNRALKPFLVDPFPPSSFHTTNTPPRHHWIITTTTIAILLVPPSHTRWIVWPQHQPTSYIDRSS
jgi:hypothetical protein